jgi:hypothetical protein
MKSKKIAPFFIVGSGRCGTKLLMRMLRVHKNIEVIPETHFIPTLYRIYNASSISYKEFFSVCEDHYGEGGYSWMKMIVQDRWGDYGEFKREMAKHMSLKYGGSGTIRQHLNVFFEIISGPCKIVGDKTPHYGTVIDEINEVWPNAKYLHLMRDGVDVAKSMKGHSAFRRQITGNIKLRNLDTCLYKNRLAEYPDSEVSIDDAMSMWYGIVSKTKSLSGILDDSQYMELKYESLLIYPQSTISKVLSFLGHEVSKSRLFASSIYPSPFHLSSKNGGGIGHEKEEVPSHVWELRQKLDYPETRNYNRAKEFARSLLYYISKILSPKKLLKNLYSKVIC